jgi:VWFA-related protein
MLAEKPVQLREGLFSNRLGKAGLPATVTVILIDSLNTDWRYQPSARLQVLTFLADIRPEDHVALYTLGSKLRVLHDFTTNSAELIAKLKTFQGEVVRELQASKAADIYREGPEQRQRDPDVFARLGNTGDSPLVQREAEFFATERATNTLKAMETIAAHLAGLPGRKSLIWVSGSFPIASVMESQLFNLDGQMLAGPVTTGRSVLDDFARTVRRLNHAGVAVYPVDARGLMGDDQFSAPYAKTDAIYKKPSPQANIETLIEIASQTGGRAFYNRNDIRKAIQSSADDSRISYTIGYYPAQEPDGKYHDIKVKVNRAGVTARFRRGYFAFGDVDRKRDVNVVKDDIAQAMWSPLDATGIALNASVRYNSATRDLEVRVQVDPNTITIEKKGDRWAARLDFAFAQKDEERRLFPSNAELLELNLIKENYEKMQSGGLIFNEQIPREERANLLRVVVRDGSSGLTGSLSIPLANVPTYTPNNSK